VDIALDGGHHDLAGPAPATTPVLSSGEALLLDVRHQVRHGLLHHASTLDHLWQEHPATAEEIADHVHARHQRAFDDVERPLRRQPRLLGVLHDPVSDALHERVGESFSHRLLAP